MAKDFPENGRAMSGLRATEVAERSFVEGLGASMRALQLVIRELARSEVPVLLLAEGGAGKRATAERIHQMSAHWAEPLRIVTCAEMREEDFDGEVEVSSRLFGSGTVYLEEVAD